MAHALAQGMGFAGEVSEVNADSPEDTSHPFQYSNEYTRKDYPDWPNRRILPPLGFVGLPEIKDSDERTQPIVLGGKEEITDIARVESPKGCVPRLPLDVDEVRDFAEYHSIYTFNNGVFTAEVHLLIKRTEIPALGAEDQSLQEAIADDQSRYTEIRSGAVSLNAPKYLPKASSNPDATKLVDKRGKEIGFTAKIYYLSRAFALTGLRNSTLPVPAQAPQQQGAGKDTGAVSVNAVARHSRLLRRASRFRTKGGRQWLHRPRLGSPALAHLPEISAADALDIRRGGNVERVHRAFLRADHEGLHQRPRQAFDAALVCDPGGDDARVQAIRRDRPRRQPAGQFLGEQDVGEFRLAVGAKLR